MLFSLVVVGMQSATKGLRIFCNLKSFLVNGIQRYTIICMSGLGCSSLETKMRPENYFHQFYFPIETSVNSSVFPLSYGIIHPCKFAQNQYAHEPSTQKTLSHKNLLCAYKIHYKIHVKNLTGYFDFLSLTLPAKDSILSIVIHAFL